ncbi:hypothetical protein ACGFYU_28855 [Streptomyces sp. NPDC048337]|uniref:hypothetical protein n=1 Tax=Streptomyces sp. NPDC048337 TaxID=3365535 RepID=UPI0037203729
MTPEEGMRAHLDLQVALPIPGQPFEPGTADAPASPWWRPFVAGPPTPPPAPPRPIAAEHPRPVIREEAEAVGS